MHAIIYSYHIAPHLVHPRKVYLLRINARSSALNPYLLINTCINHFTLFVPLQSSTTICILRWILICKVWRSSLEASLLLLGVCYECSNFRNGEIVLCVSDISIFALPVYRFIDCLNFWIYASLWDSMTILKMIF